MARDNKKYHRNKGNPKFSQRYTRKRYEDPEFDNRVRKIYFEEIETDEYWNPYGHQIIDKDFYIYLRHHQDYYTRYYSDNDLYYYSDTEFNLVVTKLFISLKKYQLETKNYKKNIKIKKTKDLEARLHSHFKKINYISLSPNKETIDSFVSELKDKILSFGEQYFINGENLRSPVLIRNLMFFSQFWIRNPSSWDENSNISLSEHIFAFYKVPEFLNKIWEEQILKGNDGGLISFYLYILLAQGGSIRKFAKLIDYSDSPFFKQKIIEYLFKVPKETKEIRDGLLLARILSRGGTEREFEVIKRMVTSDFTNSVGSVDNSLIDWIIKYSSELTSQELNLILIWAEHERTEAIRHDLTPFSWKGRKPKRTLERAEEYHQLIVNKNNRNLSWEKNNFDWDYVNDESEKWQFIELTSSQELHEEGYQLHHCVASYDFNCSRGITAIVSLRVNDKSKLTIEIDLNSNQIRQVRGSYNRSPSEEEKVVISAWIKEKDIKVNRY